MSNRSLILEGISANTGVALTLVTRPGVRPGADLSARLGDVVPAGVPAAPRGSRADGTRTTDRSTT
ncbi:hypothetical protein [Streptomyces olivaceoviridis]|uniref:hypothetical protein n=1 Tax=Streptomyces olivaceoviridis TaxID=1921 RepID=UPI0036CE776C